MDCVVEIGDREIDLREYRLVDTGQASICSACGKYLFLLLPRPFDQSKEDQPPFYYLCVCGRILQDGVEIASPYGDK